MFTVRQMRYFEALAVTRHFGAAADKVGVSQPALSVQIAEMEKSVGVPLFERMPKGVILTPTGRDFLPVIRSILKQMKTLDEMSSFYRGPFHGSLRIGVIPTLAPYLLPAILPRICQVYPELSLEVREAKTETCASEINLGNLDLVIAAEPFPMDGLKSRHLFSDSFYLAAAMDDPAYPDGIKATDDIDLSRLLLLEEGHCLRDQALEVCKTSHFLQEFGATSLSTLLQLVSYGYGVTLIPQIACATENRHHQLRIMPFKNARPKRDIALFWRERSPRHKEYKQLADLMEEAAKPLLDDAQNYCWDMSKTAIIAPPPLAASNISI